MRSKSPLMRSIRRSVFEGSFPVRTLAVLVSTAMAACQESQGPSGPVPEVSGAWAGNYPGVGRYGYMELVIEQDGLNLRGRACLQDGVLLFKDAPIEGRYPNLRFEV